MRSFYRKHDKPLLCSAFNYSQPYLSLNIEFIYSRWKIYIYIYTYSIFYFCIDSLEKILKITFEKKKKKIGGGSSFYGFGSHLGNDLEEEEKSWGRINAIVEICWWKIKKSVLRGKNTGEMISRRGAFAERFLHCSSSTSSTR